MSAPLCTVCLDTGSKSQDIGGDLDCTSCDASDARVFLRYLLAKQERRDLDGVAWLAYQLGKAAVARKIAENDDLIATLRRQYSELETALAVEQAALADALRHVASLKERLNAAPVVPVAAQPVVPGLEFVQAIANNFDSHDRENDEIMCRGCSAPELWIEETQSYLITHRPECIVLRARAFLAAPQPAASVTDVAKDALKDIQRYSLQEYRDSDESMYSQMSYDGDGEYVLLEEVIAAIAAQQGEKT